MPKARCEQKARGADEAGAGKLRQGDLRASPALRSGARAPFRHKPIERFPEKPAYLIVGLVVGQQQSVSDPPCEDVDAPPGRMGRILCIREVA